MNKKIVTVPIYFFTSLFLVSCSPKYTEFQKEVDSFIENYNDAISTEDSLSKDLALKGASGNLRKISKDYENAKNRQIYDEILSQNITQEMFDIVYEYCQTENYSIELDLIEYFESIPSDKNQTETLITSDNKKKRDDIDKSKYPFDGLISSDNITYAESLIGKTDRKNNTNSLTQNDDEFLNREVELFGYYGNFSATYVEPASSHEYFDLIIWTSVDKITNYDEIFEPMILFYGNDYEVDSTTVTSKIAHIWKLPEYGINVGCCQNSDDTCSVYILPNNLKSQTDYSPSIGMTADEVRNSKWGEPSDINKTTTQYSTSEQWVYKYGDDYKYIYFTDGVVTGIQE